MNARINLADRAAATDAVLKRFRNRALDFKAGATCLHLMRAQMIKLGHRPPRIPAFHSAAGAAKAMKRAGFPDLAAVVDSVLPRIAPAAMLVGDFGLLPGDPDGPFDSLVIGVGGKVLGWHDSDLSKMSVIADIPLSAFIAAWRL